MPAHRFDSLPPVVTLITQMITVKKPYPFIGFGGEVEVTGK